MSLSFRQQFPLKQGYVFDVGVICVNYASRDAICIEIAAYAYPVRTCICTHANSQHEQ